MIIDVDLRPKFQTVRHQGLRSSCLAFAATAAHEGHLVSPEALCVEFLFYHSVQRMPGGDPGAGATMQAMRAALNDHGQPIETDWPYLPSQPTAGNWLLPGSIGPVWKSDSDLENLTFDKVVGALDGDRTVILGLVITASFIRCGSDGFLPATNPDPARGGHAVLAVGHGQNPVGERHILVRNSWGESWGDVGHAWLSRPYIDDQLRDTATLMAGGNDGTD